MQLLHKRSFVTSEYTSKQTLWHLCHLAIWWCRSYNRPSPASPGGSKATYAVKKTERETAWEWG